MKAKAVIYVLAAALLAAFVLANWALLVQPVEMNFLLVRVEAPLAVLLLLLASVVLLVDFSVHAVTEHAWIRNRRALARELEVARVRLEQEESARTNAMTSATQKELAIIRAQLDRLLAVQFDAPEPAGIAEMEMDAPRSVEPELIPPRDGVGDARARAVRAG